jgi:multicomponent K+:H+ antiporter subunit G
MDSWIEIIVACILFVGGLFMFIGSLGLVRLPDIYTRLHAPTKATTLGIAGILLSSCILFSIKHGTISINEWLITLFLLITAPVTANMIAKTALHHELKMLRRSKGHDLLEPARHRTGPEGKKDDKDQ